MVGCGPTDFAAQPGFCSIELSVPLLPDPAPGGVWGSAPTLLAASVDGSGVGHNPPAAPIPRSGFVHGPQRDEALPFTSREVTEVTGSAMSLLMSSRLEPATDLRGRAENAPRPAKGVWSHDAAKRLLAYAAEMLEQVAQLEPVLIKEQPPPASGAIAAKASSGGLMLVSHARADERTCCKSST